MPTIITPLVSKLVRWLVGLFCAFLIGHDYKNAASIIVAHTPEIVSACIGIVLTFGPDVWLHLSKSKAFVSMKERFNMPASASPADVATMAVKAANIAETAVGKPLAAIRNPAPMGGIR